MPDLTPPRLMDRAALRRYLAGLAWNTILERIEAGKLPRPLWRLPPEDKAARWDGRAVDRALDAESDIPATIAAEQAALDRHFGLG